MASKRKEYKLEEIIPLLSEESLNVAHNMIDDALFMEKQLKLLREDIDKEGCVEMYKHGENQQGFKQSVKMATYLQMQKSYGVIIRYLTDLLPKVDKTAANVNLLDWVNNN